MMNPNTVASHHPQFNPVAYEQQQQPKPVRPKPAAAAKGKKSAEAAPIFLRKTFHMIDSCDPTIASWSKDGLSFVVKDTDKFAAEIIGQFFKHNNFSSFVRQLNFYGFRKIKSDPLRIKDAQEDIESRYWKFRHEKFQRGRPDLLAEIRKSNHNENAEKQDVDSLRSEIKNLKNRMATMNKEMERMASLVANLMQNQHLQNMTAAPPAPPAPVSNKKRKICSSPLPSAVSSTSAAGITGGVDLEALDDISVDLDMFVPPPKVAPSPMVANSRQTSAASFNSTDEEILSSLFALDSSDDLDVVRQKSIADEPSLQNYRFPETRSRSASIGSATGDSVSAGQEPDPILMTKLRNALSVLPKNLQELFVERIIGFVVDPESFKKQVDAISSLAVTAASEARNRMGDAVVDNSAQTNELASAVLGAWLSRYGSSSTTAALLAGGGGDESICNTGANPTSGPNPPNDSLIINAPINNENMAMSQEVLSACDPLQYNQQRPSTPDSLLMASFPVL